MDPIEYLGFVAGALTTIALVPQVIRLWKLKRAGEISLLFNLLYLFGGFFWLSYGIFLGKPSIIATNTLATLLVVIMLIAKLKYRESL